MCSDVEGVDSLEEEDNLTVFHKKASIYPKHGNNVTMWPTETGL